MYSGYFRRPRLGKNERGYEKIRMLPQWTDHERSIEYGESTDQI